MAGVELGAGGLVQGPSPHPRSHTASTCTCLACCYVFKKFSSSRTTVENTFRLFKAFLPFFFASNFHFFCLLQDTKLWIIMEYLKGALHWTCKYVDIEICSGGLGCKDGSVYIVSLQSYMKKGQNTPILGICPDMMLKK